MSEAAARLDGITPSAGRRPAPQRIIVLGESNSGKTTLVNALLGAPVLPTSFITHTAYPTVVRYAARPSLSAELAGRKRLPVTWDRIDDASEAGIRRLHVGVPLERLKTLRLIDTPGLGRIEEGDGDACALQACRGADVAIWCTPAVQAWKASEMRAWLALPRRLRQRGVLAITFMDAVGSERDRGRVRARLEAEAGGYFRRIVTMPGGGGGAGAGLPLDLTGCARQRVLPS